MFYVCEFELVETEGIYAAIPFGLDGGTQGETLAEAEMMAADWLRIVVEDAIIHSTELPEPSLGNEPQNGGIVMLIGVSADKSSIEKVSAADAARALGVTPARVTHMMKSAKLEGFKEGHRLWITKNSLDARLSENHPAGRPRRQSL